MVDEAELVRCLQRGDRTAFEPLYGSYVEAASRTAYLITRSHAAAEDAVHDAFVEVLRNIAALRDVYHFRPWFYRIVINKAKRQLRPRSVAFLPLDVGRDDQADAAINPDEAAVAAEEVTLLLAAIEGLAEMYRAPIILRYYTDLSDAEIAEIVEVPVGTVKSRLRYARKLLQEQLQSENPATRKERHSHG